MSNPHPSKSKPFKIGRKHTGSKSVRRRGRLASGAEQKRRQDVARRAKYKERAAAYWRGELDHFPHPPPK